MHIAFRNAVIPRNFVHDAPRYAEIPRVFVHCALKNAVFPRNFVHNAASDAIFPGNFVHSARKSAVIPRNFRMHLECKNSQDFCALLPRRRRNKSSPFLSFDGSFLGRFWGMSSIFAVAHFWMDLFWRFVCRFLCRSKGEFFSLLSGSAFLSFPPPSSSSSSSGCRPGFSLLSSLPVSAGPPSPVDRQVRHCFCCFFLSVSSLCPGSAPPFPPSFLLLSLSLSLSLSSFLLFLSLLHAHVTSRYTFSKSIILPGAVG